MQNALLHFTELQFAVKGSIFYAQTQLEQPLNLKALQLKLVLWMKLDLNELYLAIVFNLNFQTAIIF